MSDTKPDPWQSASTGGFTHNNANNRRVATAEEVAAGQCCEECLRCQVENRKCTLTLAAVRLNLVCDAHDPARVK